MSRSAFLLPLLLIFSAGILLPGCSTPPPARVVSAAEQLRRERKVGSQLAERLDSQLRLVHEPEIQVYLNRLARKLMTEPSVGVQIFREKSEWRTYGLPGVRVYVPVGLLRHVEYENELAGAIAFEVAHVLKKHPLSRLPAEDPAIDAATEASSGLDGGLGTRDTLPASLDFFGPAGIFAYSAEENESTAVLAVDLLYKAGFDPRGLLKLWVQYGANGARSPFDPSLLKRLEEKTRKAISSYIPLRNPVVRSPDFLSVMKRIERL